MESERKVRELECNQWNNRNVKLENLRKQPLVWNNITKQGDTLRKLKQRSQLRYTHTHCTHRCSVTHTERRGVILLCGDIYIGDQFLPPDTSHGAPPDAIGL